MEPCGPGMVASAIVAGAAVPAIAARGRHRTALDGQDCAVRS